MKKIYTILITILLILSSAIGIYITKKQDVKESVSKENKSQEQNKTYKIYNKISGRFYAITIYNELKNITIELIKSPRRDDGETIYLYYTVWNKTGIQIYNEIFLQNETNITINMPPEPPYMIRTVSNDYTYIHGDSMIIDTSAESDKKSLKVWYELKVDKPNSSQSIYYELNNTTFSWNFHGIDLANSSFYGKFTIKDPNGREVIMIEHTKDGWDADYSNGARFTVRGIWKITLETYEESGYIKLPLWFGYMDKEDWNKRGFTFV